MVAWFVVPLFVWIVFLGVGFVDAVLRLVTGGAYVVPMCASLASPFGHPRHELRAIWLLSRNGTMLNCFGDRRDRAIVDCLP